MNKLLDILRFYFKSITEDIIRDNFVVIYELLDEVMDNGHPQTTDPQILSQFIKQTPQGSPDLLQDFSKMLKSFTGKEQIVDIPQAVSNVVSWRQEGIVYSKNEIFMDIVETINVLQDYNSAVIKSEIVGTVQVKSQLSGMP